MPLSANEKDQLAGELQLVGDMGEPEALIAVMRDACARKANDRRLERNEANRWQAAANALTEAEAEVMAQQAPRKPEAHKDVEWSQETQRPPEAAKAPNEAKPPETP
jgi:hypothetical protein